MIRVLLDENLPRKLKWTIEAEVLTVPERGWSGVKNGKLLRMAAEEFDVFITMDQGIEHQQNLNALDLCIFYSLPLATTLMTCFLLLRKSINVFLKLLLELSSEYRNRMFRH